MRKRTTVSIPTALYWQLEEMIRGRGFTSVSEYATYVLREVVALKKGKDPHLTPEDLEQIRKKLEALGYI
jgi:metal-responsive CopG/Arc/MetJ family transcriptional regulator